MPAWNAVVSSGVLVSSGILAGVLIWSGAALASASGSWHDPGHAPGMRTGSLGGGMRHVGSGHPMMSHLGTMAGHQHNAVEHSGREGCDIHDTDMSERHGAAMMGMSDEALADLMDDMDAIHQKVAGSLHSMVAAEPALDEAQDDRSQDRPRRVVTLVRLHGPGNAPTRSHRGSPG